jgi:hypothetical protein
MPAVPRRRPAWAEASRKSDFEVRPYLAVALPRGLNAFLACVIALALVAPAPTNDRQRHSPQKPAVRTATTITGVTWEPGLGVIHIGVDSWPATWPGWRLYLNGSELPMEGGERKPVVRPDAAVSQPPTGLFVGALPWLTALNGVDFPCCGTIQFDIPGEGLTNAFAFNLSDLGCRTASTTQCPSVWTVHEGDLIVDGGQTLVIEGAKFFQKGNVYVRDSASLVIKNSEFMLGRGDVPTIHVSIFVDPAATLVVDGSQVYPSGDGLAVVSNKGEVRIVGSPTSIHLLVMSPGGRLTMQNSRMVYTIGGLLQVGGGSAALADCTLGAIGLSVPAGAHLNVAGLQSGTYFESWNVRDMIPDADYTLTLQRTTILKDDFLGHLEHGPYERGWQFYLDPAAHVRIADSEVRKLFLDIRNETQAFQDLRIGVPASLTYRDIAVKNVVVKGEWAFTTADSDVTFTNSEYLFLQPSGSGVLRLVNSQMVEFIPRNFRGAMVFENGLWINAGEILAGTAYHSETNDFLMKGTLKVGEELRQNLQWKGARVTREYPVIVTYANGVPAAGLAIKYAGKVYTTDSYGAANPSIAFDETNYNRASSLEAWRGESQVAQRQVDFFSETPVRVGLQAVGFTDDPLTARGPFVKALHITELRQAIDVLRARYGLGAASWTDATLVPGATPVKAAHVLDLRAALAEAYAAAGRTPPTWPTSIVAGQTTIAAAQIIELREAVKALW